MNPDGMNPDGERSDMFSRSNLAIDWLGDLAWPDRLQAWQGEARSINRTGDVPTYVPYLAQVDRDRLAVAGRSRSGQAWSVGAVQPAVPLMSVIKPFVLAYSLDCLGPLRVWSRVDRRPSSLRFNALAQLQADGGRPRNAMVNSGAIALADLLPGRDPEERSDRLAVWLAESVGLAPGRLVVDQAVLASVESRSNPTNRAIAAELARAGHCDDPKSALQTYNRICCLAAAIDDLAQLALLFLAADRAIVLESLATCGLYEASADWLATVPWPAKSGISGLVLAIVPDQGAIVTYSPSLNDQGNPIAGLWLLQQMWQYLNQATSTKLPVPQHLNRNH